MVNYLDKPVCLFLRLSSTLDPGNALQKMEQLEGFFKTNCKEFKVVEVVFTSAQEIFECLRKCRNNTIAMLVIITHGNKHSLQTGMNTEFSCRPNATNQEKHRLERFCSLLGEKVIISANIFLIACECAYFSTHTTFQGPNKLVTANNYTKTRISNICNVLSIKIPGVYVCGTAKAQVSGEFGSVPKQKIHYEMKTLNTTVRVKSKFKSRKCCDDNFEYPVFLDLLSGTQAMFRFYHTPSAKVSLR